MSLAIESVVKRCAFGPMSCPLAGPLLGAQRYLEIVLLKYLGTKVPKKQLKFLRNRTKVPKKQRKLDFLARVPSSVLVAE